MEAVDEVVFISGDYAGHAGITIQTTQKTIDATLKKLGHNRRIAKKIFVRVSWDIGNCIGETHYMSSSRWDFFCETLLEYYCCQNILFNKPIPIINSVGIHADSRIAC